MDLGTLKGPAELLASKVKAFKNCLELATDCLTKKDYMNAEMIYGGILADLRKDCLVEALNLNDLELFSLHSCFAYSSIGADYKSEQALVILNSIHKPIKLPLVPYLKAFVHISNDRISFANDELQCCQNLLNNGYNFKPNSILNEDIVPEINDEFLKLKLNGLKFVCELLKAKEDNDELKKCFKGNWLKIGKLCETDFAKLSKLNKEKESPKKELQKEKIVEIRVKKGCSSQSGAIKKTEVPTPKCKTESIAVQTITPKHISVSVQTIEKGLSQQLLATVLDIRNKMNNMQNKKDNEIKQLQKKNSELNEKLIAKDNKRQEKWTEFEFLKGKYVDLEKKYEQSQKQIEFLQKILVEQVQQKYQMQKNIYQLFEEKCDYKIEYLNDIQKYLNPIDRPTPDDCKQEVFMWTTTLNKIIGAKRSFEAYYRSMDELLVANRYSAIKTSEWPSLPAIPNDVQDVVHRNFKTLIQQNKSVYNVPFANQYSIFGNYGNNFRDSFHNPNYFVSSYNTYKENGRTTGSPPYFRTSPPNGYANGNEQYYQPKQHPPQQKHHQQPTTTKKLDISPPSSVSSDSSVYQSEQDLLKFLQTSFEDVGEIELIDAIYQVRDGNGGTLENYPKKILVNEIKKILKKKTKSGWNVTHVEWHNDHSESRCCICFEDYDASTSHSLPCQHEFHKKCITNWLKRQSACPVCRVHAVIDEDFPPLSKS